MQHADLNALVRLYRAENRLTHVTTFGEANPRGRLRSGDGTELVARDKASLDLFWLRDESLLDSDKLPAPEVIAAEIIEDREAALNQLKTLEAQ